MITLRKDVAEKVNFYAKKLELGDTEFMANIVTSAVTDEKLIYDFITSKYFKPVMNILKYLEDRKKQKGKEPKVVPDGA